MQKKRSSLVQASEKRAAEAGERVEAADKPSHEQSQERDLLGMYLEEMKTHAVPDAERERQYAQRIEELELAHWSELLAHTPALPVIRAALKEHMREPRELSAMRKHTGSRGQAGQREAIGKV